MAVLLHGASLLESDAAFGANVRGALKLGEQKISNMIAMASADNECRLKLKASESGLMIHRFLIGLILGAQLDQVSTVEDEVAQVKNFFRTHCKL